MNTARPYKSSWHFKVSKANATHNKLSWKDSWLVTGDVNEEEDGKFGISEGVSKCPPSRPVSVASSEADVWFFVPINTNWPVRLICLRISTSASHSSHFTLSSFHFAVMGERNKKKQAEKRYVIIYLCHLICNPKTAIVTKLYFQTQY